MTLQMLDFSRYRLAILRVGYAFMLLNRRRYLTKSRGKCLINELTAELVLGWATYRLMS